MSSTTARGRVPEGERPTGADLASEGGNRDAQVRHRLRMGQSRSVTGTDSAGETGRSAAMCLGSLCPSALPG